MIQFANLTVSGIRSGFLNSIPLIRALQFSIKDARGMKLAAARARVYLWGLIPGARPRRSGILRRWKKFHDSPGDRGGRRCRDPLPTSLRRSIGEQMANRAITILLRV